jgi:hypothetical protein
MAIFASGVEGGAEVSGQTDGINLSVAGDYALLLVSNAVPPGGPDSSALVTLSGTAVDASVTINKAWTSALSFTPLSNVTDSNGASVGSPYAVPTGDVDLNLNGIAGMYAIQIILNATPTSGYVNVQGASSPGSVTATEASILSQTVENSLLTKALVLALSDQNSTDYLAAVGGTW